MPTAEERLAKLLQVEGTVGGYVLREVKPEVVTSYLETHGWQQGYFSARGGEWHKRDYGLWHINDAEDISYVTRLRESLGVISLDEGRPPLAVLHDLFFPDDAEGVVS